MDKIEKIRGVVHFHDTKITHGFLWVRYGFAWVQKRQPRPLPWVKTHMGYPYLCYAPVIVVLARAVVVVANV